MIIKFARRRFPAFFIFTLVFLCLIAVAGAKAAVFTVTNLNDSGAGSLRQAILDVNNTPGAHVINFQAGLTGTITITSPLPVLANAVTINGPGADLLTIQRGAGAARIFRVTSTVVLNGLTIANGFAPNSSTDPEFTVALGGGIFNEGNLTINNCRLSGNSASGSIAEGGAIYNGVNASVTIRDSDFIGNSVNFFGSAGHNYGAAIFSLGVVDIDNTTFASNSGTTGLHSERSLMRISRSTVTNTGSFAAIQSGIVNFNSSILILENSTIFGNPQSAIYRGGSYSMEIRNSTIVNNRLGIHQAGTSCLCSVNNSIVAGNINGDLVGGFTVASGYNLIGNGAGGNLTNGQDGNIVGTSQAPVNPQLAPLGNYGGRTQTHRLLNTSPAINAGNPLDFPVTDQRGVVRPVGGRSDIGAFEFNLTPHRYLPRGGLNANYNQALSAFSDVPEPVFSFALTEGALPPGISLSPEASSSAILTGTPTAVGTFNFTITATTAGGFTISASYSLTIQNAVSFVAVRGRVLTNDGKPVSRAQVLVFDTNGNVIKQSFTNPFGYYRFKDIQAGETYSFKVVAKNRRFTPQNITVNGELSDFNFIAEP